MAQNHPKIRENCQNYYRFWKIFSAKELISSPFPRFSGELIQIRPEYLHIFTQEWIKGIVQRNAECAIRMGLWHSSDSIGNTILNFSLLMPVITTIFEEEGGGLKG